MAIYLVAYWYDFATMDIGVRKTGRRGWSGLWIWDFDLGKGGWLEVQMAGIMGAGGSGIGNDTADMNMLMNGCIERFQTSINVMCGVVAKRIRDARNSSSS
jgi:hypothetical protein